MAKKPIRSPGKSVDTKALTTKTPPSGHHPPKTQQFLFPIKEIQHEGFAVMGVLSDGTPYLTLRGLARMCGIDHAVLLRMNSNWEEERTKPRGLKITELLKAQKYRGEALTVGMVGELKTHAFPDAVCMAVLEYYAFEANQGDSSTALQNYRALARETLRAFIFRSCGYDPDRSLSVSWQNFQSRVLLNDEIPIGYFCIFREMADLIVHLIKAGCPFDDHTVPDISVGSAWSRFWNEVHLDDKYGTRQRWPHTYPDWYPQSAAGPQEVWMYPAHALGAFHTWIQRHYITQKFPAYLETKVKKGVFLKTNAEQLLIAVKRKEVPALSE